MTIYFIMADLTIKEETFCVANLEQFNRDMNEAYGEDGWYDDIEDAKECIHMIKKDNLESIYPFKQFEKDIYNACTRSDVLISKLEERMYGKKD